MYECDDFKWQDMWICGFVGYHYCGEVLTLLQERFLAQLIQLLDISYSGISASVYFFKGASAWLNVSLW